MKAGTRLQSTVCATNVVVVKSSAEPVALECGGAAMAEGTGAAASGEVKPGFDTGTLLGKRYSDEVSGLELLCTKGGDGTLTVNGRVLQLKAAKALPASD
jgi:hypothetical protein